MASARLFSTSSERLPLPAAARRGPVTDLDGGDGDNTVNTGTGTLTIGRSQKCDVAIDSGSVSRHHANLSVGQDVLIEDIGRNGERGEDELPARPATLTPEMEVEIREAVR